MPRAKKSETAVTETTASVSAVSKAQHAEEPKQAAPEKKTTTRKPAAKKPAAAKKTSKEPEVSVVLEYGGKQIVPKELVAKAMENFKAAHGDVEVNTRQLYINTDESCAYLVVNDEEYPEDKIEF